MTALAGLPLYLDLAKVVGLSRSFQRHLRVRDNGQEWTDGQVVMALIMLNLAGGEHVEDLRGLEEDEGWCRILRQVEMHGLKRKVRRALERRREWAEVCFVPNKISHSKHGLDCRYLATREVFRQLDLPGMEEQAKLPFQTLELNRQRYKVSGIVTNMDWEGEWLIVCQQERCGKSEEEHKVMKEDLAGGKLPSVDFGEISAWWWIMVLSLNLNVIMKRLVLGQRWVGKRMKAIRFGVICLPGRILSHARDLVVRLGKQCSAYRVLIEARKTIAQLVLAPSG